MLLPSCDLAKAIMASHMRMEHGMASFESDAASSETMWWKSKIEINT